MATESLRPGLLATEASDRIGKATLAAAVARDAGFKATGACTGAAKEQLRNATALVVAAILLLNSAQEACEGVRSRLQ